MGDSYYYTYPVLPCPALPCLVVGSTHWAEIQTILYTFLGITQEPPMGDSWVIPSVTSLTERSVFLWFHAQLAQKSWTDSNKDGEDEGNNSMTRTASSLISDSMSMIGDTVSRLSKSFSTEKPDDIIPMSSIVPEKSQNNGTVEPRKCPKTQINYHHRRSQSVTSFAKYQNSKSSLTAKLSNPG